MTTPIKWVFAHKPEVMLITRQEYEHHTLQSVKSSVQASDGEFDEALRARHILILNNELRPMNMGYLNTVLELILNTLVSLSASPSSAPATDIAETLQADHDVRPEITYQVMSWFGIVTTEGSTKTWCMEEAKIVRQLGIGLLSGHRVRHFSSSLQGYTHYPYPE